MEITPDPIRVVNVDSFYRATRGYDYEQKFLRAIEATLSLSTSRLEADVIAACRGAQIILVEHPDTPFTREVIAALDGCQLIAKYAIGLDNIDIEAATDRQIVVCHAPGYCVEEVSDHAVALLLDLGRRITFIDRHVQSGGWYLDLEPQLRRMSTQILGMLGMGRIAQAVARKMRPWGMRMLCFDPYINRETATALNVQPVDLPTLLKSSDFLSLHAPLTAQTHHIIGAAELEMMKPTAWVVNTSRGRLIDEGSLAAALERKRIAGAALDVTECEPLPPSSPLRGMPNVILTSHHAAVSTESLIDLRLTIAASVEAFCRGYWPRSVANPGIRPRKPLKPWDEYLQLSDRVVDKIPD
jgi:D-3-phosphoglycerate dehydrogenase